MGRHQRVHFDGAIYHAMARGVDGRDIYADDRDRCRFLEVMRATAGSTSTEILAYCLMGNHFHLAVRVGPVTLSSYMHRVLTGYSKTFNLRHGRTGHLFQARYKAILCLDDRYLRALVAYIHFNPVRAGIVVQPQSWPWSSCNAEADAGDCLPDFDPWPKDADSKILIRHGIADHPSLDILASSVADRTGTDVARIRSRARNPEFIDARRRFVVAAIKHGYSQGEIAKWMNAARSSVSRYAWEAMG